MRNARLLIAVSAVLALGSGADASDFTLAVQGAYAPTGYDFSGTRTFTEFAEEGSISADYDSGKGPGFEAGLTWNFKPNLGIALSGGLVTRESSATFTTTLPHPLFLNQDRTAEGTVENMEHRELTGHLDLVYTGRSGSLDFSVFAGPSYFSVKSDLLEKPTYTQTYPYDTVSNVSPPTPSADDTGFGFNVGAGIAYRFSQSVGFGIQGRFSRASIELIPASGADPVEFDAGGLQVAAGLRIYF
jgi:opacity protein-like surface antigen